MGEVVNALARRGAEVATRDCGRFTSPVTREAEQRRLIALARPEHFVPIHGEYRHLARHAAHAAAEGVGGRHLS